MFRGKKILLLILLLMMMIMMIRLESVMMKMKIINTVIVVVNCKWGSVINKEKMCFIWTVSLFNGLFICAFND